MHFNKCIDENVDILSKNSVICARVPVISLFWKSIETKSSSQESNLHTQTDTQTHTHTQTDTHTHRQTHTHTNTRRLLEPWNMGTSNRAHYARSHYWTRVHWYTAYWGVLA